MSVKETTTFECGPHHRVSVTGGDIKVTMNIGSIVECAATIDRGMARDLSKALSHAADVCRTKRKRPVAKQD